MKQLIAAPYKPAGKLDPKMYNRKSPRRHTAVVQHYGLKATQLILKNSEFTHSDIEWNSAKYRAYTSIKPAITEKNKSKFARVLHKRLQAIQRPWFDYYGWDTELNAGVFVIQGYLMGLAFIERLPNASEYRLVFMYLVLYADYFNNPETVKGITVDVIERMEINDPFN